MQKILNKSWPGALMSGLLTFIAICHISFILSWICYVPLFISVYNKSARHAFKMAFIFGFTFSCFAFSWMIPGAERFTGFNVLYGLGIFIFSAALFSLYTGCVLYCFASLKNSNEQPKSMLITSLLIACIFCVAEALLTIVSAGFPWFDVHTGNGLAENKYAIQPAALFGIHIMTFVVMVVNYLIAIFISKKLWQKLYIPASIIIAYLLAGFFIFQNFETRVQKTKTLNVAILSENFLPDIKWDDITGNMFVKELLDLNRSIVPLKPDMALWSESAIPWTYRKDDDLVKAVFRITDASRITHIMGVNTAYKENIVFNSAYCILPGGVVAGRYDKQYLLSFIEQPLNGWLMPFFSSKGYSALSDEEHSKPLTTPYGKAGFLICNEAALPVAAANQVKQGAEFLLNMSNDGWFNDTYIVNLHYYYARLRAVESRKDIAINCNNGFSGLIKASGAIEVQEKSTEPFVKVVTIEPNKYITMASSHPCIFVYCSSIYIALILILAYIKKQTQPT